MFNANFLMASVIWGSVGAGFLIYGKKQSAPVPLIAGIIILALSYFASSALSMSILSTFIIAGVYFLSKYR